MTDTTFGVRYWVAATGAQASGITVLADHYSGSPSVLVTADLATVETAVGYEIELDIDTTIPHVVRFHTVDATVAQQVIYTDYAPGEAVDLTPVLDAIEDLPTAAENAAANWSATVRTLTSLPTGAVLVSALNQRTLRIDLVHGDSHTFEEGTQIDFGYDGWYADPDTMTVAMQHIQTGTTFTYEGTIPADRLGRWQFSSLEAEEQLVGDYRYDVQFTKTIGDVTYVYTPYNNQRLVVAKDLATA